jgi:hypothetical protein
MTETRFIVDAFFKSLDALIIKNRAYHATLVKLAGGDRDILDSYLKEVKKALPSAVEPQVFIDLRRDAAEAVDSREFANFVALAQTLSQRITAWL